MGEYGCNCKCPSYCLIYILLIITSWFLIVKYIVPLVIFFFSMDYTMEPCVKTIHQFYYLHFQN